MSDTLRNEIDEGREHRCTPPPGRVGARWKCSCGARFVYWEGVFCQWLPVTSTAGGVA